jgi:hypothetical protein
MQHEYKKTHTHNLHKKFSWLYKFPIKKKNHDESNNTENLHKKFSWLYIFPTLEKEKKKKEKRKEKK